MVLTELSHFYTLGPMARTRRHAESVEHHVGQVVVPTSDQLALIRAEEEAGRLLVLETEGGLDLYVPYGEGRAVPLSFRYDGCEPFPWTISVQFTNGQPRCTRLILDAPVGGYISAEAARIPLGRLLEEAVLLSAIEVDDEGKPIGLQFRHRVSSVGEARKLHAKVQREHRRRARGTRRVGRVTDDDLREVAKVYRENLGSGRPALAVEEYFKKTSRPKARSTIGRWIEMAREHGYLGQAPGRGIAGEIDNPKEDDHG
jgi:hypothetical protein